ncbi:MAG: aldo/keto reductase [Clostridia bacterium]|nr:aldo/keto reductase [Clostridia bacterium]
MIKNEFFELYNGVKIPKVGFGTWQVKDGDEAYQSTLWALEAGYRHIDTAHAYGNEESVGRAVRDSGIPREEIFITTKLPSHIKTYEGAKAYFTESLKSLGLEYLDLYLIHAPWPWSNIGEDCTEGNIEAWRAMVELYNEGKVRAIGVSNFAVKDIVALTEATGVKPMANQIRYFIGNRQDAITDYCQANDILIEAYSPLATGEIASHEKLRPIAEKYGVSIPRLCIRYCLEKGTLPLPKSVHKERIEANIDLDFTIEKEDIDYLDSIGRIGAVKDLRS